jgi:hypothetical protein
MATLGNVMVGAIVGRVPVSPGGGTACRVD